MQSAAIMHIKKYHENLHSGVTALAPPKTLAPWSGELWNKTLKRRMKCYFKH